MSEWIKCSERLPEVGEVVLAYFPERIAMQIDTEEWIEHHESPVAWSTKTICTGVGWAESEFDDITHWMPLPPPPK